MASIKEAMGIVYELQWWLENHDGLSEIPHAWINATAYTLSVGIGHWTLWDDQLGYSDDHDDDELSFDGCKRAFIASVDELRMFVE
jgi:hypothetical protein